MAEPTKTSPTDASPTDDMPTYAVEPVPTDVTSAIDGLRMMAIDTDPDDNVRLSIAGNLAAGLELIGALQFTTRAGRRAYLVITRDLP